MEFTIDQIFAVRETALKDKELAKYLKRWYRHDRALPTAMRDIDFPEWAFRLVRDIAWNLEGVEGNTMIESMVSALKVQCGIVPSVKAVMERDKKSFELDESDLNSYVEEGFVNASVWYKGKAAYAAAESTKDFFEANGWAVDIWTDEEDKTEVTVNARMDFPLYLKSIKK